MPVFLCELGPLIATQTKRLRKYRKVVTGFGQVVFTLSVPCYSLTCFIPALQHPACRCLSSHSTSIPWRCHQTLVQTCFLWTLSVLPSSLFFVLYVSLQHLEAHCTWYCQWSHSTGNRVGDSHCSPCPELSSLHSHLLPSCSLLAVASPFNRNLGHWRLQLLDQTSRAPNP